MKAAIYIRVSTEEQAREGYSIESQREICTRFINERKYDLTEVYIDEGYSSKNLKRPDIQRMLKDIELHKFNILVFWRLNRLTRSVKDKEFLFELFDSKRIDIKSMSEELDTTTASGRMVTNILVSVAQGEREQTAENVHSTMYERAAIGLRNGAVAPYGYTIVDGKLIVVPDEAEVIKRIYDLYEKPLSFRAIAKLFNQEGIVKRGTSKWADFTVQYILTNPVYCGKMRWNYRKASGKRTHKEIITDGTHEPIITVEHFERIEQLRNRRAVKREKVSSDFHFTGVLRCNRCGYGMIGLTQRDNKTGKSRRFYRCLGRSNYGICNMPIISEVALTEEFLNCLKEDNVMFQKLISVPDHVNVENDGGQDIIKREIESVHRRRKKWQEAYANDAITLDELKSHMDEERAKEEMLKARLEPATATVKSLRSKEEIIEVLQTLRSAWYEIKDELAKKTFIQEAYKEIIINTPVERGVARPGKLMPVDIVDWKFNE